jgi:hypothetical protein
VTASYKPATDAAELREGPNAGFHECRPVGDEPEAGVLLDDVPGDHVEVDASVADQVEHRQVLGRPNRVVERQGSRSA